MKTSKNLPLVVTTIAILASGIAVATAQDGTSDDSLDELSSEPRGTTADLRERHGDERGREGRHGDGRRGGERHGHARDVGGRGGAGMMMMQHFDEVDADGNGAVTQEEIDTYREARVASVDTDGDSALSIEEFDTLYRELTRSRMVDAFQNLDEDGDGVISPAELDDRFGAVVERMDRNDDGALSVEDRGRGRRG